MDNQKPDKPTKSDHLITFVAVSAVSMAVSTGVMLWACIGGPNNLGRGR